MRLVLWGKPICSSVCIHGASFKLLRINENKTHYVKKKKERETDDATVDRALMWWGKNKHFRLHVLSSFTQADWCVACRQLRVQLDLICIIPIRHFSVDWHSKLINPSTCLSDSFSRYFVQTWFFWSETRQHFHYIHYTSYTLGLFNHETVKLPA